ncbi:hypothetical protein ACFE04_008112 [Oxalis oulophora]
MAKIFFLSMLLLSVFMSSLIAQEPVTPTSSPSERPLKDTPESPKQWKIEECVKRISEDCANSIYGNIFLHNKEVISTNCCEQLVSLGKECHDTLVNDILKSPEAKGKKSTFLRNSLNVWNHCVKAITN